MIPFSDSGVGFVVVFTATDGRRFIVNSPAGSTLTVYAHKDAALDAKARFEKPEPGRVSVVRVHYNVRQPSE